MSYDIIYKVYFITKIKPQVLYLYRYRKIKLNKPS